MRQPFGFVGYARVSTRDQDPRLQIDALRDAGCDEIVEEHASGKDRKRPALEQTLAWLGEGDELIVWKIDRLGRSVLDLLTIVEELHAKGATFRSVTQPEMSTSGPSGELVFGILAAVAQYERALIRERVQNGVSAAQRNGTKSGKPFGRPPRITRTDEDEILEAWDTTPVARLAHRYKVHETTIYRAYNRAKARSSAGPQ